MSETQEKPDLRSTLESAFAADAETAGATPEVTAESQPAQGVAAAEAVGDSKSPAADAARDDKGRFAPKAEGVSPNATIPDPTKPASAAPEAEAQPIRPPASWSAQSKADFAALPPHIQQEVLKRETEVNRGFEERAAKLKQYEPFDAVVEQIRPRLIANNVDAPTYFRGLAAADAMLSGPNKVQALVTLANDYGIDLRQFSQGQQSSAQQPQAQLPPEVMAALQEIPALKQQLTEQSQSQMQAHIDAFAKDHLYFENVRPQVAALLRSGQVETLDEAYDRACWADPSIRPILMKEQTDKQTQAAREQAQAKVNDAKRAGASITGSPAPGSAPSRSGPAPSIRDSLEQQFGGL